MSFLGGPPGSGFLPAGSHVAYTAEAQQLFDRASYNITVRKLLNRAIAATKDAGVWDKLDQLLVPCAAEAGADSVALTNIISANYGAVLVNAATLTSGQGYAGVVGGYIDSMFNPTTAAGHMAATDESHFGWPLNPAQIAAAFLGHVGTTRRIEIYPHYTDGEVYYKSNTDTEDHTTNASGAGLVLVSRLVSGTFKVDQNGVEIASVTHTADGMTNSNIRYLQAHDASGYYTNTVALMGFGSGLTPTERLAFYTAWHPFIQALTGAA